MSQLVTKSDGVTQIAGRKLMLTPELREQFCSVIADVHYVSIASDVVGIHHSTIRRWLKFGEKHDKEFHPSGDDCTSNCEEKDAAFRQFYVEVKRSQAKSTQEHLQNIDLHSKNQWQASAWKLERTQPELFGMKNRVEHTGESGGPIVHKILSTNQRKKVIAAAQTAITLEENEDGVFEATDEDENRD